MFWNSVSLVYGQYGFKHLLLLLLLIVYTCLGAFVLLYFEAPHERSLIARRLQSKTDARNYLLARILDGSEKRDMERWLADYERLLNCTVSTKRQWTVWGALFYAGTVYTTIGYGDIVARTGPGRLITMAYAVGGIPLVITVLNDWGTLLFTLLKRLWYHYLLTYPVDCLLLILPSFCRPIWPYKTSCKQDTTDVTQLRDFPLKFVFFLLIFWIFFCATIFTFFQDWTYFDSVYFFFISLTTIGLGDLVPEHKVAVFNFLLLLLGLSAVSMSVNVIQAKLELMFNRFVMSIDRQYKTNLMSEHVRAEIEIGMKMEEEGRRMSSPFSVIDSYRTGMKLSDRLLLKLMSSHQKRLLEEYEEKKTRMRNNWGQTVQRQMRDSAVQTQDRSGQGRGNEERGQGRGNEERGLSTDRPAARMYIYNVGD